MKRRALILRESVIESCKKIWLFSAGRRKATHPWFLTGAQSKQVSIQCRSPFILETAATNADYVFLHFFCLM
jgi:hypothetical protein